MTLGNKATFITFQKDVAAAGIAEQLPDVDVPDGYNLVVKAKAGNAGNIYIGNSKENAEDHTVTFSLAAKGSVTLAVINANVVWIDADNNGEGIEGIVEQ